LPTEQGLQPSHVHTQHELVPPPNPHHLQLARQPVQQLLLAPLLVVEEGEGFELRQAELEGEGGAASVWRRNQSHATPRQRLDADRARARPSLALHAPWHHSSVRRVCELVLKERLMKKRLKGKRLEKRLKRKLEAV